jgi:hypothetical protein
MAWNAARLFLFMKIMTSETWSSLKISILIAWSRLFDISKTCIQEKEDKLKFVDDGPWCTWNDFIEVSHPEIQDFSESVRPLDMTTLFFTGSSLDPYIERSKLFIYIEVRVDDLSRRIGSPFRPIFEGHTPLKDVFMAFALMK